ncbi:hypothetical protein ABIC17_002889 [Sphingomonas sp. PvP056]|jgi:hypothetical protein
MPSEPPPPLHDLALELARLLARDLARHHNAERKASATDTRPRP